ncbi:ThuA domain-containing protein [Pedomonas sp. V897]|uniref:ThuA domain-containing protein n=1 Tax=Pedomonas sp. V897 TaxID=3446482 RepID=UPI003EE3106B
MVIRYDAPGNVLVLTKGHPFEREPFAALIEAVLPEGWTWTLAEHPAAAGLLDPERAAPFDVILFYDMPGLLFRPGEPPLHVEPPACLKAGFAALLEQGKPLLFLHHALAGWPAWPEYRQAIGGHFDYGRSGYRHGVRHFVRVVADHPVTAGLGEGFWIEDELYLVEVDEADKQPLLRSDHRFERDGFYAADLAVRGKMFSNEGWEHPPGSNLIGWTRQAGNSPVVYLQCGDGPSAYENEGFRRLLANAICWLASQGKRG